MSAECRRQSWFKLFVNVLIPLYRRIWRALFWAGAALQQLLSTTIMMAKGALLTKSCDIMHCVSKPKNFWQTLAWLFCWRGSSWSWDASVEHSRVLAWLSQHKFSRRHGSAPRSCKESIYRMLNWFLTPPTHFLLLSATALNATTALLPFPIAIIHYFRSNHHVRRVHPPSSH